MRFILLMVSIMCTGMRMVRAWSAIERVIGLADPPRRVGRELVAAAVFELVHRLHQADVAFLDQVEELQAAVGVFFRRWRSPGAGWSSVISRLARRALASPVLICLLMSFRSLIGMPMGPAGRSVSARWSS